MTYVELIVVLSIFSVMTSIALFDYNKFQAKVDIKVLANEIALKIVEAQKFAMSGKIPIQNISSTWKPSYGIYFDLVDNKNFIYFANTIDGSNNSYDDTSCNLPPTVGGGECLDYIHIKKDNFIKDLKCSGNPINNLTIVFRRPNSGALMSCFGDVEIIVSSPGTNPVTANIKVYPSGRIQIN